MPAVRNIVRDFRVEEARAERKCHANSSDKILAGEKHFAYDDSGRINICKKCADSVLKVASDHIEKVRIELSR
ncbi:hypothetical protein Vspart_03586 [Vibrio spartinae]|uniref:Uncharacterized protein n=1 Tax=Vibrio spartinae TaxID=1918945 RepID=A0ABX6R3U4_9VIBR|nr:hypothetical protein Vspart_03586 [Vibrio spartinae]